MGKEIRRGYRTIQYQDSVYVYVCVCAPACVRVRGEGWKVCVMYPRLANSRFSYLSGAPVLGLQV